MNLKLIGMLAAMAAIGVAACTETTTGDDAGDTDTDTGTGTDTGPDTDTDTGPDTGTGTAEDPTGVCAENFCQMMPADSACFQCIQQSGTGDCQSEYQACVADPDCVAFFMGTGGDVNDAEVQALGDCVCTPGVCLDE